MPIKVKVIAPKKGAIEKQVRESLERQLESKLKDVKCLEHQEMVTVTVTDLVPKPKFKIEGCCQRLIDDATEALK